MSLSNLLKYKIPSFSDFEDVYTQYTTNISDIYNKYNTLYNEITNLETKINTMLIECTNNVNILNSSINIIQYINNNKQTESAILTEKYKYISCKNFDSIHFSSLDILENIGINIKHNNLKTIDYDILSISTNIPHKTFIYNDFIGKTDSEIANDGVYFGKLYGNNKIFELNESPWYNDLIIKQNDDNIQYIEYCSKDPSYDNIKATIAIKPKNQNNKIDILYLSLFTSNNCFIEINNIKYRQTTSQQTFEIPDMKNKTIYIANNSKYSDISIPIHLDNVDVILIELTQNYKFIEYINNILIGNRTLNILESLIVDRTYAYYQMSDKQFDPTSLYIQIQDILGDNTPTITTDTIYKYSIGIRNIQLYTASDTSIGEVIFDDYVLDSYTVAVEILSEARYNNSFEYYIAFDNTDVWYKIVPSNIYEKYHSDSDIYRYYIRKPSVFVKEEAGVSHIYDDLYTSPQSFKLKVIHNGFNNDDILSMITIREKKDI